MSLSRRNSGIIVFDGDSIALGQGASSGYTLADQVTKLLGLELNVHVTAVGGRQVKECLNLFASGAHKIYNADAEVNVIFFNAGDNDIAWGSNASQTYGMITEYVTRAHRQGWLVVVSTKLQRFDWPISGRQEIDSLNNMILENSADADGVADFYGNPVMSSQINRLNHNYYVEDHVHPANGGYGILASIAAEALFPLFTNDFRRPKFNNSGSYSAAVK